MIVPVLKKYVAKTATNNLKYKRHSAMFTSFGNEDKRTHQGKISLVSSFKLVYQKECNFAL